jgi:hypothetical protein
MYLITDALIINDPVSGKPVPEIWDAQGIRAESWQSLGSKVRTKRLCATYQG